MPRWPIILARCAVGVALATLDAYRDVRDWRRYSQQQARNLSGRRPW